MSAAKPPRRWSKRRLALVVSGLIVAALVLVLGLVGAARSVSFVMNVVDATGDIGQITPERAGESRQSVPHAADAPAVSPPTADTATPAPSAVAQSGAANATMESAPQTAPLAANGGTAGSGASGATTAGSGGSAGASSPSPTRWESFVHGTLTLLSQNTISMCGRNTCSVGQICCNASCGTCVAQGATCDPTPCAGAPRTPTVVLCGTGQCNDGEVCCNPSCGTCVTPGETCSNEPCR